MTTCVMGVLRLLRRVIRGSSAMASATGRLRLRGLASLFTLALLGTVSVAHAQTSEGESRAAYIAYFAAGSCSTSFTVVCKQVEQATTDVHGRSGFTVAPQAGVPNRVTPWIGYDYDGAQRQTAVYDHMGNCTAYVPDNAGNRTSEQGKDPSGALTRLLARSIDVLGHVQQTVGGNERA